MAGAVLTLTVPSSETTSVEGRMKAGRTPQEPKYQPLTLEPSVPTLQTPLSLLASGERSHQMAALLPL